MVELGYTPNLAARALITGRSKTLGLVVLNEELHGPASALRAIEQDARAAGYGVRIIHLSTVARSTLPEVVESLRRQQLVLELPMAPRFTYPDPRLNALRRTVAVERGPLVYCLERLAGGVDDVAVDAAAGLVDEPAAGPGDVAVHVRAAGRRHRLPEPGGWPYRSEAFGAGGGGEPEVLHLLPYYAWANRGPSTMRVWIPTY